MPDRIYRVAVAQTRGGLFAAAPDTEGWTILRNTIREFAALDSNDDQSLGDIGRLFVGRSGWVALAYLETDDAD